MRRSSGSSAASPRWGSRSRCWPRARPSRRRSRSALASGCSPRRPATCGRPTRRTASSGSTPRAGRCWPASRPASGRSTRCPRRGASGSRTSTAARSPHRPAHEPHRGSHSGRRPAVRARGRRRRDLGVQLGRGHRLAHRPAHEQGREELRRGHGAERAAARVRRALGRRLRRRQAAEARPGERPRPPALADRARRLGHRVARRAVGVERARTHRPHRPEDRRGKAQIKVGANPLATAWIGGELWVPSIDADSVSIVDPAANTVRERARPASGPPRSWRRAAASGSRIPRTATSGGCRVAGASPQRRGVSSDKPAVSGSPVQPPARATSTARTRRRRAPVFGEDDARASRSASRCATRRPRWGAASIGARAGTVQLRVVVVDNASTDGTFALACAKATEGRRVIVYRSPRDIGRIATGTAASTSPATPTT